MNEQNTQSYIKERVCLPKAFRFLTAVLLALLLLLCDVAVGNVTVAFAGDEEALGTTNGEAEMPELGEENEEPEPDEGSTAMHPIAKAIAREGRAYVRVGGEAFSGARMRRRDLVGSVSGIAIAIAYNEADDGANRPASLAVVLVVGEGLKEWHIDPASAALLNEDFSPEQALPAVAFTPAKREERPTDEGDKKEENDPDAGDPDAGDPDADDPDSDDPDAHDPDCDDPDCDDPDCDEPDIDDPDADDPDIDEPDTDEPDIDEPQPIKVNISFWGTLGGGTVVVTAQVEGVPKGVNYTLQWQNNISGEFEDMPGETGENITVNITNKNIQCEWRAVVILAEGL